MKITKNSLKQLIKEVLAEEEEVDPQDPQEPKETMSYEDILKMARAFFTGGRPKKAQRVVRTALNQAWRKMRRLGIENVQKNPNDKRVQAWIRKGRKKGKEWTTLKYNHPARQKVRDLGKARKRPAAKPAAPEPPVDPKKTPGFRKAAGGKGQVLAPTGPLVTLPGPKRAAAFKQLKVATTHAEWKAAEAQLKKIPGGKELLRKNPMPKFPPAEPLKTPPFRKTGPAKTSTKAPPAEKKPAAKKPEPAEIPKVKPIRQTGAAARAQGYRFEE